MPVHLPEFIHLYDKATRGYSRCAIASRKSTTSAEDIQERIVRINALFPKAGEYRQVAKPSSPRTSRRCWPQLHPFSHEDDVCGAIAVRRLELVTQLAIAQQRQPLFRHRWPCDVTAQSFQVLAFMRLRRDTCVQRESSHLAHGGIDRLIAVRQRLLGEHLAGMRGATRMGRRAAEVRFHTCLRVSYHRTAVRQ
jgi:hypothetical protein